MAVSKLRRGAYNMNIGEVILNLRKEKQLTQEQLAQAIGVSAPAVSKWETGVSQS